MAMEAVVFIAQCLHFPQRIWNGQ